MTISWFCSRFLDEKKELLEEIVVDEMHIAHIYKAYGFNLRLLSLWLLFHW